MATCQTEISAGGFETIRLRNACMSVSVLPQLGGKIYEIVDLRSGRDWLWKNPHIALRHPLANMDYDRELDSGGWDEILFSVKPCELDLPGGQRLTIGDHGIAVDRAWKNVETGINDVGDAVCELFVEGHSPHFKFQRKIVLDTRQPRLNFEYSLNNTGSEPWPWLWCAHPLFAIENDMHITLPKGQQIKSMPGSDTNTAPGQAWPYMSLDDGGIIDLAGIFKESIEPETFCRKLFVRSAGEVSIDSPDGTESFSMVYSPVSLPWLGIWVNKKAWSGCGSEPYFNLGLEPATAPHDFLTEAVAQGNAGLLQAGESRNWSLSILLKNSINKHG